MALGYTFEQLVDILDRLVTSWNVNVRCALVEQGYRLEQFVFDKNENVRAAVAKKGYGLNILLNDSDWRVRAEVAKHGYGLEKLVHDRHSGVRIEVAKQQYGLDILIDDDVWCVREAVARQGYGLDRLMFDKVYSIREAVAQQGYGLDVLLHDEDESVRNAAIFYLRQEENKRLGLGQGDYFNHYSARDKSDDKGMSLTGGMPSKEYSEKQLVGILNCLVNHKDSSVRSEVSAVVIPFIEENEKDIDSLIYEALKRSCAASLGDTGARDKGQAIWDCIDI